MHRKRLFESPAEGEQEEGGTVRVRLPRGKQTMGIVEELLGGSRFRVKCSDGRTRMCRIPGKFRKRIFLLVSDAVLVEPWDVQPEDRGDIIWIYTKAHAAWLRKKGML